MNQDLALKVLGQIMNWSDEHSREEFRWLRLMARLKYDGYRDFQAGMRFIESLAASGALAEIVADNLQALLRRGLGGPALRGSAPRSEGAIVGRTAFPFTPSRGWLKAIALQLPPRTSFEVTSFT